MRTATEIEAKAKGHEDRMQKYQDRMNDHIFKHTQQIEQMIYEQRLFEQFKKDEKITAYEWTHERTVSPQKCFVSKNTIYSFTKGYRGTKKAVLVGEINTVRYPKTIWLTKEEFTVRRLRGQL